MALFHRIFSSKKGPKKYSDDRNDLYQKTVPPKLDKSKIRLVIYADTDRGRTPYFDSNAIKRLEEMDKNVIKSAPKTMRAKGLNYSQRELPMTQQKQAVKYHFQRLGNDVKVLEEMMFGTVAMAFKGSSLKVHLLRSPHQLMVTKVFIPEKPARDGVVDMESDSSSLPGSSADFSSGEFVEPARKLKEKYTQSTPVDVPSKESDYSTDDDSGLASFTSSGSLRTSFPSPSNSSLSSYNSLHRRWMRAQTTSLDGHHRQESTQASENSVTRPRRSKLAVGILFGSHDEKDEESNELFQSFFFSHFALIEGHVEKLRSVVEKAYFNTRYFLPATMEALESFRNDIYDLYMAPRMSEPVWLTMMSTTSYRTKLCEKFMDTFVRLVTKFDNKNNKFFVSTLLSAVLTQHLAWVATVTPAGGTPSCIYLAKHSAKWVDTLAKTHPYNPLWAQLGDLFGAIGPSLKISRTVVVGKKADVVKSFLYILSYFIRCSEVQENSDLQCLSNIVNDSQFDLSLSPTLSEKTLLSPERGASPTGSGALIQQSSNSSADKHFNGLESKKSFSRHKREDTTMEDDSNEHVKRFNSVPAIPDCIDSTVSLERSDSGYNGACLESSEECGITETNLCCKETEFTVNHASIASSHYQQTTPVPSLFSKVLYQDQHTHLYSDSESSPGKSLHITCSSDSSVKTLVKAVTSTTSPAAEGIGISELHIYENFSTPVSSLTPAKITESPRIERVTNVGNSQTVDALPLESLSRSQSFSDGKIRSKLSQQLECESVPVPLDSRRLLVEGSSECIEEVGASEKIMTSSGGSASSWFSGEYKKEGEVTNKPFISRQASQDSKSHSGRPSTLARGRPITPTELSRRRHLSSTGSIDYEAFDPMIHCKPIKLPYTMTECGQWHIKAFDRNFGRSLLASYTDHYMSDFVLHGTSDTDYKSRLLNDLQMTVKHSVLDETIDEAVCVIADTDTWTVEVASSKVMGMSPSGCTTWVASKLVADLIESVVEISKMKMSSEFCLMHLEDRLQEIYFKSVMLSEYLRGAPHYNQRELTAMLGFEPSDMPLLFAVAGTHTPNLALGAQ